MGNDNIQDNILADTIEEAIHAANLAMGNLDIKSDENSQASLLESSIDDSAPASPDMHTTTTDTEMDEMQKRKSSPSRNENIKKLCHFSSVDTVSPNFTEMYNASDSICEETNHSISECQAREKELHTATFENSSVTNHLANYSPESCDLDHNKYTAPSDDFYCHSTTKISTYPSQNTCNSVSIYSNSSTVSWRPVTTNAATSRYTVTLSTDLPTNVS